MMTKQDNTIDPMRAIGMSAAERDVRERLKHYEAYGKVEDDEGMLIEAGVLRALMRDLDMWRKIVTAEIELRKLEEP
jgi:hypothetical protein